MALTKLEENLNIIENLPDSPTLEARDLKRKFDEGSVIIKEYINEVLTKEIDDLLVQIKKDTTSKLLEDNKKKYYVGKIILDTKNVNPATYLGFGTWQLWGSGRVPVGVDITQSEFNTVEKTGGEKTHILNKSEMPSHTHNIHIAGTEIAKATPGMMPGTQGKFWNMAVGFEGQYAMGILNSGESKAHNNIQPYVTCYMWKRIS